MRKKILKNLWVRKLFSSLLISLIFGAPQLGCPAVFASTELDRQFDLGSVGALRADDNMDGLFGDYVAVAYREYFARESRFIYNDLSKSDPILTQSKLPYSKLIHDTDILGKLARVTRTESILRTRVLKQNTKYIFTIDWLHSPGMELMATINFSMDQPSGENAIGSDAINEAVGIHLTRLFQSIPFVASVSGRDQNSVTVNLGSHTSVKPGDTLVIATLDAAKKHPLLKSIVDWQLTPVGKVSIDQTEDGMAFGHILSEEPGRQIARSQKVIQVISLPVKEQSTDGEPSEVKEYEAPPRLGYVGVTALLGIHSRQYSSTGVNNTGGGIAFGGRATGELWLTKEWFVDANFGYATANFTQQDVTTQVQTTVSQAGGASLAVSTFRGEVGYAFLMTGDFFGPKGWVKAGYKATSYSLPTDTATEFTGPVSMSSVMLGLGGEVPIRGKWGARIDLNYRIFSSTRVAWVTDTVSGAYDVDFFLGGYYRYNNRISIRFGLDAVFSGVDFTAGTSLGQKTITIGPALLYYL